MAITTKNRKQLKAYFVKNAIPTEGNFSDLVDAGLNQAEDGVFKLPGEPLGVVAAPGEQRRALRFYSSYPAANPDWQISLSPALSATKPETMRPGLGLTDGAGNTRLFVDAATGNLGLGTTSPSDRLTVTGGDVRIEGEDYRRLKVVASDAGLELLARNPGGSPHIDFTQGPADSPGFGVRLAASDNKTLSVKASSGAATLRVFGDIDLDGTLGKLDVKAQTAATIRAAELSFGHPSRRGNPGRALVDNKDTLVVNFGGDWPAAEVQSPLSIKGKLTITGNLGVGTAAPEAPLDIRVAGGKGWDRFLVTTSDAWEKGVQRVTIGAGGAPGVMINNPYVSWNAAEKRASIRYGQSTASWDVGIRENDAFTFISKAGTTALSLQGNDAAVTGSLTAASLTTPGAVAAASLTAAGAVAAASLTASGAVTAGSFTTPGAVTAGNSTTGSLRIGRWSIEADGETLWLRLDGKNFARFQPSAIDKLTFPK